MLVGNTKQKSKIRIDILETGIFFLSVIKRPPGSWWLNFKKISGFGEKQKAVCHDKYPYLFYH